MKPIEPMEPMSVSTVERIKNNYIVQAWLVLTLALFFGASLAGIQIKLGPTIETNKINETLEKVPEMVLGLAQAQKMAEKGESLNVKIHNIEVEKSGRTKCYNVFEAKYPDGKLAGWVTKAKGQGYADKIELLVGLDPHAKTINGLFVLDQKETPGLGNKMINFDWRKQFIKKGTDAPLIVTKEGAKAGNEIDSITGATISSRAVCSIVNNAVKDLKKTLAAKAKGCN